MEYSADPYQSDNRNGKIFSFVLLSKRVFALWRGGWDFAAAFLADGNGSLEMASE
jgi:hypothetical protein